MEYYTPKKLRPWALTSLFLRGLIRMLELCPLVLLLAVFISPIQPHFRYEYRYFKIGHSKIMTDCDYLGLHGKTKYRDGSSCPFIVMIDTGKHDVVSHLYRKLLRKLA
jgi:hypothetical protein